MARRLPLPLAQEPIKLKMMFTAVTGSGGSGLAEYGGFFKKRGIEVEFIPTQSSGNNPAGAGQQFGAACRSYSADIAAGE